MSKQDLSTAFNKFNEKHTFELGQIVEWKPGMKTKRIDGPLIVVEILPQPIIANEDDSGTPYFREPLDMLLGKVDDDGDFTIYHHDSRRFQPAD